MMLELRRQFYTIAAESSERTQKVTSLAILGKSNMDHILFVNVICLKSSSSEKTEQIV